MLHIGGLVLGKALELLVVVLLAHHVAERGVGNEGAGGIGGRGGRGGERGRLVLAAVEEELETRRRIGRLRVTHGADALVHLDLEHAVHLDGLGSVEHVERELARVRLVHGLIHGVAAECGAVVACGHARHLVHGLGGLVALDGRVGARDQLVVAVPGERRLRIRVRARADEAQLAARHNAARVRVADDAWHAWCIYLF